MVTAIIISCSSSICHSLCPNKLTPFSLSLSQPPFNGNNDEELFQNILKKSVRYPLGMTERSVAIVEGVRMTHKIINIPKFQFQLQF